MIDTDFDRSNLNQLAKNLVNPEIESRDIWALYNKSFLYRFFKTNDSGETGYLAEFNKTVNMIISDKKNRLKGHKTSSLLAGKWLCFDPSSTMYDELAEEESLGFFDSDDVPPPEFWVCIDNDLLISFIPSKFLDVANLGVDCCISGSLFWMEKRG